MNFKKMIGGISFCCLWLPTVLHAQDASNMIPKQSTVKDTSRQTDLIDIAKDLFKINPQQPRVQREKKIYFSILPIPGAVPGGTGGACFDHQHYSRYLAGAAKHD